jgi:hypothetical protein
MSPHHGDVHRAPARYLDEFGTSFLSGSIYVGASTPATGPGTIVVRSDHVQVLQGPPSLGQADARREWANCARSPTVKLRHGE